MLYEPKAKLYEPKAVLFRSEGQGCEIKQNLLTKLAKRFAL
jgi:hypothetical protein